MTIKTQSESLFEEFCIQNNLEWRRIEAGIGKTPDYYLRFGSDTVAVEIKQIETTLGYHPGGVSSRTVGWHVRQKITEARGQLQAAAQSATPAVLLIHNTIDSWQLFGTEEHDFICAMYGELTLRIEDGAPSRSFHGRNAKTRADANTSFSGVGHLSRHASGAKVVVYENVNAAYPLPFAGLPSCIEVKRVKLIIPA